MKKFTLLLTAVLLLCSSNIFSQRHYTKVPKVALRLQQMIDSVPTGDTLVLLKGGNYRIYTSGTPIIINKKLTIMSEYMTPKLPGLENLPKISNADTCLKGLFKLQDGADVSFIGVEINNNMAYDIIVVDTITGTYSISFDRCRIHNTTTTTGENGMILGYPSDKYAFTPAPANRVKFYMKKFRLTNSIIYRHWWQGCLF